MYVYLICVCVCVCMYVCMYVYIYSAMKSILPPSCFFFFNFLHIFHTWMIQIIKLILLSHKHKPSKYKMQFWNNDFIC